MAHKHSIYDADPHFTIDPSTRRIKNESNKVTLVRGDHNSERFTFEIPRYVDGHDMSVCDVVEIHYDNIDSSTKETYSDVEEIDDLQISPNSDDVVIFSWLISGNATQYKGALNFSIGFQCHDSKGNIDYELGTLDHEGITVGGRIRNSKSVIERVADILSKWRNDLFGIGDTEEAKILAVSQEQQAAIKSVGAEQVKAVEAKGADVLASIPDEFEAVVSLADENARIKAGAIVLNAEGNTITLTDSSNGYLQGLKLFGKSEQDGEPTPDSPVDIISPIPSTIAVYRSNLVEPRKTYVNRVGVTIEQTSDGNFTVNGTRTGALWEELGRAILVEGQTYTLSASDELNIQIWDLVRNVSLTGKTEGAVRKTFTPKATGWHAVCLTGNVSSMDYNNVLANIIINIGDTALTWEPNSSQKIAFESTASLHGIPVTSGGNYTDSDGQQWVCDEIDFERGVYVQRVDTRTIVGDMFLALKTNDSTYNEYIFVLADYDSGVYASRSIPAFCNKFTRGIGVYDCYTLATVSDSGWDGKARAIFYVSKDISTVEDFMYYIGENCEIQFVLKSPIETPISESELAAFRALKTNKFVTTIVNDSNAYMEVDYVADTKTYIDNQIAKCVADGISTLVVEHDGNGAVSLSVKETTNT